ncbi:hypothetical protein CerSpe_274910 [Prunus speciosa]
MVWPIVRFLEMIGMEEAGNVFSLYDRRVVVTKMPRVMVERFVKEHLTADEVVGKKSIREVEKKERKKKRKRGKKKKTKRKEEK